MPTIRLFTCRGQAMSIHRILYLELVGRGARQSRSDDGKMRSGAHRICGIFRLFAACDPSMRPAQATSLFGDDVAQGDGWQKALISGAGAEIR